MKGVREFSPTPREQRASPDEPRLAVLAGRQRGLVTSRDLAEGGFSSSTIDPRVRRGTLHPLHRGVYVLGPRRISPLAHLLAAVLAVRGSVLSHRSAASLWGLVPISLGAVDVTH